MRLISFFLTTPQFLDGTKDVTRRIGWWNLKPGDRLMAVKKSQGRKKGEPIERLGEIEVVSACKELLHAISQDDCRREGFPEMRPTDFVEMFSREMKCEPWQEVNRIEFKRVR